MGGGGGGGRRGWAAKAWIAQQTHTRGLVRSLGLLHLAIADEQKGMDKLAHVDAAQSYLQAALATRRKVLPPDHADIASTMYYLASALRMQRRFSDAERMFVDTITLLRRSVGDGHEATATALNNYAFLLKQMGQLVRARDTYREALTLHERVMGVNHPDTLTVLYNLAQVLRAQGDGTAADEVQADIVARYEAHRASTAATSPAPAPPPAPAAAAAGTGGAHVV